MIEELDVTTVDENPIKQFQRWFDDATKAQIQLPEAMTLATISRDCKPSARIVLLKHVSEDGFEFYTNYHSPKGSDLEIHPSAALVFYWNLLERQVRVEGTVKKVSAQESENYFRTRPRESQIGAMASAQSAAIASREDLDRAYLKIEQEYAGKPIPRPQHWGGYRLRPTRIEFWKNRTGRLHDRIVYDRRSDKEWLITRLQP